MTHDDGFSPTPSHPHPPSGTITTTPAYTRWCKTVHAKPRPKDPLAKRSKGTSAGNSKNGSSAGGVSSDSAALVAMIRGKQALQASALDNLMAKYVTGGAGSGKGSKSGGGGKGKGKKQGGVEEEPSDAEFEAARARLEAKRGGGGGRNK